MDGRVGKGRDGFGLTTSTHNTHTYARPSKSKAFLFFIFWFLLNSSFFFRGLLCLGGLSKSVSVVIVRNLVTNPKFLYS